MMEAPRGWVAATVAVVDASHNPSYLQVFNPVLTRVTATLRQVLFDPWVAVPVIIVGLLVLVRARSGHTHRALFGAGWAVLVIGIVTVASNYPIWAGSIADDVAPTVMGDLHNRVGGTDMDATAAAAENVTHLVLWENWLTGTFGSADSPTARKYARDIYEGQALTWAEARQVSAGEGDAIIERKQQQWVDAAEAIEKDDPDAYAYLVGKRSEARMSAAGWAIVSGAVVLPLIFFAACMVIASLLIIRFVVMFLPVLGLVGLVDRAGSVFRNTMMVAGGAVLGAVVYTVAGAVAVMVYGVLLDPAAPLPSWLQVVLAAVTSVVIWVALKPFRRSPGGVVGRATGVVKSGFSGSHQDPDARAKQGLAAAGAVVSGGTSALAGVAVSWAQSRRGGKPADSQEAPGRYEAAQPLALPPGGSSPARAGGDPRPGALRALPVTPQHDPERVTRGGEPRFPQTMVGAETLPGAVTHTATSKPPVGAAARQAHQYVDERGRVVYRLFDPDTREVTSVPALRVEAQRDPR
jgi:hypothetical protein